MKIHYRSLAAILAPALAILLAPVDASAQTAPAYKLTRMVPLGAPDRWDYVTADPDTARVYVAHGDRVTVLDAATGAIVAQVEGMPGGTHGISVSTATGQGFTDDGTKGEAVAFDLRTLKVLRRIHAAEDADGIARDPATGRVFVANGDSGTLTVIDPSTDAVVATVTAGEKLEFLAADKAGQVYVAGAERSDLLRVDARSATITARWPTPDCKSPHGLAVDAAGGRVFVGCVNAKMMVVDSRTGRVVADLPIGLGNDAVAWDPVRRRVFSSNGRDGTISVYRQVTPDRYAALPTITTVVGARTMATDPRSGRLFVVASDTDSSATPGGRPRVRPGTARLMIYDPVG